MIDTLKKIFEALTVFYTSKRGTFIAAILGHWYLIMLLPTLAITYYFFDGLMKSGILQAVEHFIIGILEQLVGYAQKCFPKMANLKAFFNCFE